jgi:hypothetical protein
MPGLSDSIRLATPCGHSDSGTEPRRGRQVRTLRGHQRTDQWPFRGPWRASMAGREEHGSHPRNRPVGAVLSTSHTSALHGCCVLGLCLGVALTTDVVFVAPARLAFDGVVPVPCVGRDWLT